MSRGSRRKTLSHSEIENFLSEINVDQKQGLNKDSSAALAGNYSLSQPLEVVCTDPMRTEVQAIREFCRVCQLSIGQSIVKRSHSHYSHPSFSIHRQHSRHIDKENTWNQQKNYVMLGGRSCLVRPTPSSLPDCFAPKTTCILLRHWKARSHFC